MRGWVNSNTDLLSVKLHQSYGHTKTMGRQDSTVNNYADGWTSRRPNYGRCHPVVCPVVFTTNQNINTVVDLSIWHLPNTVRDFAFASNPHRKQFNGLDVSPCCHVFCPIVAHSVVNTTAQTGRPPVAIYPTVPVLSCRLLVWPPNPMICYLRYVCYVYCRLHITMTNYTSTKSMVKMQLRAARFVKQDYRSTTSVSSLISQLGWQTLSDRRRNSHLSLMYKSLHGLAGISISSFRRCSSPLVQLMATYFVSCPLEPILINTPSILTPLLTGMPSRHLWSLVLPFIRSAVRYIPTSS